MLQRLPLPTEQVPVPSGITVSRSSEDSNFNLNLNELASISVPDPGTQGQENQETGNQGSPEVPDKCPHCKYETKNKSHMKDHIRIVHEKILDFQCSECSFATGRRHQLARHYKAIHKMEMPLERNTKDSVGCSFCPFVTSDFERLNKHIASEHMSKKEPPAPEPMPEKFYCKKCLFKTHSQAVLTKHILDQHPEKQNIIHLDDDYTCPECDFSTSSRETMKKHWNQEHQKQSGGEGGIGPNQRMVQEWSEKGPSQTGQSPSEKSVLKPVTRIPKDTHKCPHCPFTTPWPHNIERHVAEKHKTKAPAGLFG